MNYLDGQAHVITCNLPFHKGTIKRKFIVSFIARRAVENIATKAYFGKWSCHWFLIPKPDLVNPGLRNMMKGYTPIMVSPDRGQIAFVKE